MAGSFSAELRARMAAVAALDCAVSHLAVARWRLGPGSPWQLQVYVDVRARLPILPSARIERLATELTELYPHGWELFEGSAASGVDIWWPVLSWQP
jgi:hypothetical protein